MIACQRWLMLVWALTLCSQLACVGVCVWLDQEFLVCSRCATSNVIQNCMPRKLSNKSHHQKTTNFEQQMWPCGRKAWEEEGKKNILAALNYHSEQCLLADCPAWWFYWEMLCAWSLCRWMLSFHLQHSWLAFCQTWLWGDSSCDVDLV